MSEEKVVLTTSTTTTTTTTASMTSIERQHTGGKSPAIERGIKPTIYEIDLTEEDSGGGGGVEEPPKKKIKIEEYFNKPKEVVHVAAPMAQILYASNEKTRIMYCERFLGKTEKIALLEKLKSLEFHEEIAMGVVCKRKTIAFANSNFGKLSYTYARKTLETEETTPEWMLALFKKVEEYLAKQPFIEKEKNNPIKVGYNFAFINYYPPNALIGRHSDDEEDIDTEMPIASLSLGGKRPFNIWKGKDTKEPLVKKCLASGSLLLMAGECQKHFTHAITSHKKDSEGVLAEQELERFNITFRKIKQ